MAFKNILLFCKGDKVNISGNFVYILKSAGTADRPSQKTLKKRRLSLFSQEFSIVQFSLLLFKVNLSTISVSIFFSLTIILMEVVLYVYRYFDYLK